MFSENTGVRDKDRFHLRDSGSISCIIEANKFHLRLTYYFLVDLTKFFVTLLVLWQDRWFRIFGCFYASLHTSVSYLSHPKALVPGEHCHICNSTSITVKKCECAVAGKYRDVSWNGNRKKMQGAVEGADPFSSFRSLNIETI